MKTRIDRKTRSHARSRLVAETLSAIGAIVMTTSVLVTVAPPADVTRARGAIVTAA